MIESGNNGETSLSIFTDLLRVSQLGQQSRCGGSAV